MTQSSPSSAPTVARAQEPWSVVLASSLAPEETILAGLQLDLDARLHFTHGWLVVTNRRLIGQAPGEKDLQSWDIAPGMTLAHSDHAGVGSYYGTYDAQKIFEEFDEGEIGITRLNFEHSFWCKKMGGMATAKTSNSAKEDRVFLSGTQVRQMLSEGTMPPEEFTRPEVAKILIDSMKPA